MTHDPMPFRNVDPATGETTTGDRFPGESLLAELMASALAHAAIGFLDTPSRPPERVMDHLPEGADFGFNVDGWLASLREHGYTVTVGTDTVTFTILRG